MALLVAFVPGIAGFALAHEGATGVVKERMDLMKKQAKQMKLLNAMAKGKTRFDAAKAAHAARDIETTTKTIPELFPEGSATPPSEALPEIWRDWEAFKKEAETTARAADALAKVLENQGSGEWKQAFKSLTDACKSCHQSFRAEDDAEAAGGAQKHHH